MKKNVSKKKEGKKTEQLLLNKRGFGVNEVIGLAAGIIIAAVIVIPGLKGFATGIISKLTSWWDGMATGLFGV